MIAKASQFMRSLGKHLGYAMLILIVMIAASLVGLRLHGEKFLTVQTASMQPVFKPGDAVLVREVSSGSLRVGDIISYTSPRDARLVITHRLLRIDSRTGWLTTGGDALHSTDPTFPPRLLLGRVTAIAPGLGTVLDSLRTPLGMIVLVYIPAILTIIAEIRRLAQKLTKPQYRSFVAH